MFRLRKQARRELPPVCHPPYAEKRSQGRTNACLARNPAGDQGSREPLLPYREGFVYSRASSGIHAAAKLKLKLTHPGKC